MMCSLCGKPLKSINSIQIGYGPVCYRKIFGCSMKSKKEKSFSIDNFPYYDIPGQMTLEDYLEDNK